MSSLLRPRLERAALALANAQQQGAAADQQVAQVESERGALKGFLSQTESQQVSPSAAGSADDFGIGDSPEAARSQQIQNIQGALSAGAGSPTPFSTARGALSIASSFPVSNVPQPLSPQGRLEHDQRLGLVTGATETEDPFFAGTSVPAQDSRNLNTLRGKILRGGFQSLTGAERGAYGISYDRATQPKVVRIGNQEILQPGLRLDPALFPVPPGLSDRAPQPAQQTGAPQTNTAPAGQATGLPPGFKVVGQKAIPFTDAAKLTASKVAQGTFNGVRGKIINQDGSINRGLLASMDTNLPFSDGRQVNQEMEDALESRIRAESGAAVPEAEIKRMARRLTPNSLDSDSAVISKLDRAQKFFDGVLDVFDIGRGIISDSTSKQLGQGGGEETAEARRKRLKTQFNLSPVR